MVDAATAEQLSCMAAVGGAFRIIGHNVTGTCTKATKE